MLWLALPAVGWLGLVATRSSPQEEGLAYVQRGTLSRWVSYQGVLEARQVDVIASQLSGSSVVEDLAPEGMPVQAGDMLARFDQSQLDRDRLRIERDYLLAEAELHSLEHADLPLKLNEMLLQLLEARAEYEAEKQYLAESIEMMDEGLVSGPEVEKQRLHVERLHSRLQQLIRQVRLTREFLHPARLAQARATFEAAEQALHLARRELEHCVLRAPRAGVVSYRPLHIGADYRVVRVGDTLYKNQPFMAIPDMSDVVVECHVPEGELALISEGAEVVVVPIAYPSLTLQGRVQTVASVAQMLPGRSAAQKYFRVLVDVHDADPRLRSGMTVIVRVLAFHEPDTLLLPRTVLQWRDGEPFVEVKRNGRWQAQPIAIGRANDTHVEISEALEEGLALRQP
jgi:multidrug resistance efflux pump